MENTIEKLISQTGQPNKKNKGFVYVISNPINLDEANKLGFENFYKIGYTTKVSVEERIKDYRAGNVFNFVINGICETEEPRKIESLLHKFFKDNHINCVDLKNEWYAVDLDTLKSVTAKLNLKFKWNNRVYDNDFKEFLVQISLKTHYNK